MRPRWLMIGLVASIALNLFLIGAGAGIVALGLRIARENAGARPAVLFWAAQPMSPPARRETRRLVLGLRDQVRPDVERSRSLKVQAWSALGEAKPDGAAIKQTLARSRQIDVAIRTRVEAAVVDQVLALPPPDRAAYASAISRELGAPRR
ncbi:MAG TPA: periplasmic heavy metal sensor [Caulobacteraceae bacterium]|jgi:uncharacterized membrane protein